MKFKITDTVDALGEPVVVWHSDFLSQQKQVGALAYDALSFLLKNNWAMAPYQLIQNSHKVIWAENTAGEPMGGVIYEYHNATKQGFIVIIFTDEKFRGRRIYSILQRALENEIIRLGGTSIASQAHKDNVARLKAGEREGMLPEYYRLYKDLTTVVEDRKQEMIQSTGKTWAELDKERWNTSTMPPPK
jgi:hypothetical protein